MAKISNFSDHFNRPAIEGISYEGTQSSIPLNAFKQSPSIIPTQATIASQLGDLGDASMVFKLVSNLAPNITDRDLLRPHVFHAITQSLKDVPEIAQNYPKLLEEIMQIIANHESVIAGAQALVPA